MTSKEEDLLTYFKGAINYPNDLRKNILSLELWKRANVLAFLKIENWFVERDDRAECLILFILWKVLPICGESLKKSIREAEWKYE